MARYCPAVLIPQPLRELKLEQMYISSGMQSGDSILMADI